MTSVKSLFCDIAYLITAALILMLIGFKSRYEVYEGHFLRSYDEKN